MLARLAEWLLLLVLLAATIGGVFFVWRFAMYLLPDDWQFPVTLMMMMAIILAALELAAVRSRNTGR